MSGDQAKLARGLEDALEQATGSRTPTTNRERWKLLELAFAAENRSWHYRTAFAFDQAVRNRQREEEPLAPWMLVKAAGTVLSTFRFGTFRLAGQEV